MNLRYRSSACDPSRLGSLWKKNCKCNRKDCFKRLSRSSDDVQEFLERFYDLSKPDQDDFEAKQHITFEDCLYLVQ